MAKKDSNPFKELEDKLSKELERRAKEAEQKKKTEVFANMISGGKPPASFDDMKKFMEDPFNAKGWAKTKRLERTAKVTMEFDLEPLTEDELKEAREAGKLDPNFGA